MPLGTFFLYEEVPLRTRNPPPAFRPPLAEVTPPLIVAPPLSGSPVYGIRAPLLFRPRSSSCGLGPLANSLYLNVMSLFAESGRRPFCLLWRCEALDQDVA